MRFLQSSFLLDIDSRDLMQRPHVIKCGTCRWNFQTTEHHETWKQRLFNQLAKGSISKNIPKMLFFPAVLIALVGLLPQHSRAHNIQLGAHSRECFHEQLHKDDKMTVTFQVGDREFGGSGSLEIDFWVRLHLITSLVRVNHDCMILTWILPYD